MEDTDENNILIAEFIGFDMKRYKDDGVVEGYSLELPDMKSTFSDNQLKFHSDWNWLMSVLEKIDNLEIEVPDDSNLIGDISCGVLNINIEETNEAIITLIKWYNENKQN